MRLTRNRLPITRYHVTQVCLWVWPEIDFPSHGTMSPRSVCEFDQKQTSHHMGLCLRVWPEIEFPSHRTLSLISHSFTHNRLVKLLLLIHLFTKVHKCSGKSTAAFAAIIRTSPSWHFQLRAFKHTNAKGYSSLNIKTWFKERMSLRPKHTKTFNISFHTVKHADNTLNEWTVLSLKIQQWDNGTS